jgi:hypothetical protein
VAEQAYIVFNAAIGEPHHLIDEGVASDADVDVKAVPYREFVNANPTKISYFQPILDTLEVTPSKFDYTTGGVIVEGKHDYYCILLACQILGKKRPTIFPAIGSGTMGSLVALHRGWGLPVRVLFDSDQGGKDGKKRLSKEFNVTEDEAFGIGDLIEGIKTMEDLFTEGDRSKLGWGAGGSKTIMFRRIQEIVAAEEPWSFEAGSRTNLKKLIAALSERCPQAFNH